MRVCNNEPLAAAPFLHNMTAGAVSVVVVCGSGGMNGTRKSVVYAFLCCACEELVCVYSCGDERACVSSV